MIRLSYLLLRPASQSEALALRVALLACVIVLIATVAHYAGKPRAVHLHVSGEAVRR